MAEIPQKGNRGVVLIVDRDEAVRTMVAALLRRAGFTTRGYADCDAIGADAEQTAAAIVRDVDLSARNRAAALEEIERVPAEVLRRTVIMTTAPAAVVKNAALAKAFAVVRKPFEVSALVDAVRRCSEQSRQHRVRGSHRGADLEEGSAATVNVARVERFLRSVPKLRALLGSESRTMHELLLGNEMRRTTLELANVLYAAAQLERDRKRAAVLLGAARAAAELAGAPAPLPAYARSH
ncbi:MAG: hypothetical protein JO197_16430 [Acidobacteria bacterium]|nr:hypothetical protein [Acidobacteriota bacterium]MBV9475390.1 hypothetical protein [Acidobacteriota bacterium]